MLIGNIRISTVFTIYQFGHFSPQSCHLNFFLWVWVALATLLPVEDGDGRGQEKSMLSGAGAAYASHGQRIFFLWGERGNASWLPLRESAIFENWCAEGRFGN
jgi:hypothetical protein